jgi:hypothetical protein
MEHLRHLISYLSCKKRAQIVIAENQHDQNVERSCEALALSIQAQWPNPDIENSILVNVDPAHVDVERALEDLTPEWQRLTRNHELAKYLDEVQVMLDRSSAQISCHIQQQAPTYSTLAPKQNSDISKFSLQEAEMGTTQHFLRYYGNLCETLFSPVELVKLRVTCLRPSSSATIRIQTARAFLGLYIQCYRNRRFHHRTIMHPTSRD